MQNKTSIVVNSDNNLAFAVATLFTNLLETKNNENFLDLNVLVTPDFKDEYVKKIKSIELQYRGQCSIDVVKMDHRFDNIRNKTGYITNCAAYRMCVAEMFPLHHKMLYLDTDIIVFDDLYELFNTDITGYYIGGVFSIEHYIYRNELIEKLVIPDLSQYVNSGVLLLNLDEIRKNRIEEKLHGLLGSYDDSVDQHIFNKVCYGHIKLLPFKYNVFQSSEWLYESKKALVEMTETELEEVVKRPVIYHYTGTAKPWNTADKKYALKWFRYYKKSPFADNKLPLSFMDENEYLMPKLTFWRKLFSVNLLKNKNNTSCRYKIYLLGIQINYRKKTKKENSPQGEQK